MPKPAAAEVFNWDDLARFKDGGRFLDGYPEELRTFWSPIDNVHGMLVALLESAQHSFVLNMYGYDDEELDATIRSKLADDSFYVQMSLDRSQAGGKHEKELLKKWGNDAFGNSIAIGTSSRHAISHLKIVIVDGVYTVRGSTNWSLAGEEKQDNELTLSRNAVIAAETRAVLDRNHDWMLKQMAQQATGKTVDEAVSAAKQKAKAPARTPRAKAKR
jgi:PLD-like domain